VVQVWCGCGAGVLWVCCGCAAGVALVVRVWCFSSARVMGLLKMSNCGSGWSPAPRTWRRVRGAAGKCARYPCPLGRLEHSALPHVCAHVFLTTCSLNRFCLGQVCVRMVYLRMFA
jgi:hypothetical protein